MHNYLHLRKQIARLHSCYKQIWPGSILKNEKALRRANTALAVVRRSRKFSPRRRPISEGVRRPKSNQLKMVTIFTYTLSLVKIDARNFELLW